MKRLIFLLSILFLMLQSCSSGDNSSSDNSSNDSNSLLLKKWYLVSQTSGGKTYYNTPCSNGNRFYIEFISPSIYNEYHYNSTSDCNYSVEGPYKWIKNGDNIDFSSNGTIYFTATISELTVTTLKMVVTDSGHSSLCVYNSY